VAAYSFNTYVEKLIDNCSQVRGCMTRMEGRLIKTGKSEEFNKQIQDNIERGV
jgi:hypothetical protein